MPSSSARQIRTNNGLVIRLEPRLATAADIPELLRLRALMFESMGREDPADWRQASSAFLEERIDGDDVAAFVVDDPVQRGHVIACGIVVIIRRLGSPRTPSGRFAHIQSMVTEPASRRQGLARAVLAALVDWCTARGVTSIDLHASKMGEPLYRSFGFHEGSEPELRLP